MAKIIRLFEKRADGTLVEVDQQLREGRLVSRVSLECDVLWTAEEEAARAAEEAEKAAKVAAEIAEAAAADESKANAILALEAKLAPMGLTADDIKLALGL